MHQRLPCLAGKNLTITSNNFIPLQPALMELRLAQPLLQPVHLQLIGKWNNHFFRSNRQRPVYTSAGGVLNSEQYLSPIRGGTGVDASLAANGQLLIGNGNGFDLGFLTGTQNQINIASSAGEITFSLPQNIAITSTPTFSGLNLTNDLNQLVLGNTDLTNHTTTISASSSAGNVFAIFPCLQLMILLSSPIRHKH